VKFTITIGISAVALLATAPARAEVVSRSDAGFVIQRTVEVPAGASRVWHELVRPSVWWNGVHTFSGDAANLSLDLRPGGCFCERLPAVRGTPGRGAGAVEHLRVVHFAPGKLLRLSGGLGPLQSEGLSGALTFTLTEKQATTEIKLTYVVGGYMRYKSEQIAPAVDQVLGEQLTRLAKLLGGPT
jgi:hypothetical protein